jgi:steroid 5-alpha reductase family enzyme
MTTLVILGAAVLYSFFSGLITRNYSHVDRLWSILPGVYVLVWLPQYINNPRYIIPAIIVLLWCIRLTTNFALKGGGYHRFEVFRLPGMEKGDPGMAHFYAALPDETEERVFREV